MSADLTDEQAGRSARFCAGYRLGLSDARAGYASPVGDDEFGRGYRLGYARGPGHPSGPALLPEGTRS